MFLPYVATSAGTEIGDIFRLLRMNEPPQVIIQALIADSQTEVYASRALVLSAAAEFDAGTDTRMGPSCAKYFASEAVGRVADRAVQVFGGAGYMHGVTVERFSRGCVPRRRR